MLVLTRRIGQSLRVGPSIEIRVVRLEGDRVVLGITAPKHVAVVRSELVDEVSDETRDASDARAALRIMLTPRSIDSPTTPDDDPGIA
jgi:carbon storage regulator